MDIDSFRLVLEDLSGCLEKQKPYKQLLVYKKGEEITYFITDRHVLKDCADAILSSFMYWPTQEGVQWLADHLTEYEYEGDVTLLGWLRPPDEHTPIPVSLN